jgi:hypothetical protein
MIFVILAVATITVIVGIVPVAVVVNNVMPGLHCSLCCWSLLSLSSAAFTTTTAAGVSNAPQPLLPPLMWHHFPVEPPWS